MRPVLDSDGFLGGDNLVGCGAPFAVKYNILVVRRPYYQDRAPGFFPVGDVVAPKRNFEIGNQTDWLGWREKAVSVDAALSMRIVHGIHCH